MRALKSNQLESLFCFRKGYEALPCELVPAAQRYNSGSGQCCMCYDALLPADAVVEGIRQACAHCSSRMCRSCRGSFTRECISCGARCCNDCLDYDGYEYICTYCLEADMSDEMYDECG